MTVETSRRRFLSRSGALLAAAGASPFVGDGGEARSQGTAAPDRGGDAIPIIDTHQHLWDLSRLRLPWLAGNAKLNRNFVMSDYREAAEGLGVERAIYMEVHVDDPQIPAEAEQIVELCRRGDSPTVAAVIGGRPASDGFEAFIGRYRDHPIVKGVRQVLHGPEAPAGTALEPRFVRGVRLLGELGLSFDLTFRATELADAAKLIDACPDTRFILDHCGCAKVQGPDQSAWRSGIEAVARRKNVVCKVSGIVSTAAPGWTAEDLAPTVNHVLDSFGPDRVMFGSDWPVCTLGGTYRQWVEALRVIVSGRSEGDRRRLFHDNAQSFYRLA